VNDGRAERAFELIKSLGSGYVMVDAATERELMMSQRAINRASSELGVSEDGLAGLIRGAYKTLGLISFFTTGEDETAPGLLKRSTAPIAGAAIHNDLRRSSSALKLFHQ